MGLTSLLSMPGRREERRARAGWRAPGREAREGRQWRRRRAAVRREGAGWDSAQERARKARCERAGCREVRREARTGGEAASSRVWGRGR